MFYFKCKILRKKNGQNRPNNLSTGQSVGAVGAVGAVTVCGSSGSSGSSEVYVGEVKSMRDAAVKSKWEQ